MWAPVTESDLHLAVSPFLAGNAVEFAASHRDAHRIPARRSGGRAATGYRKAGPMAAWQPMGPAPRHEQHWKSSRRWHPPKLESTILISDSGFTPARIFRNVSHCIGFDIGPSRTNPRCDIGRLAAYSQPAPSPEIPTTLCPRF